MQDDLKIYAGRKHLGPLDKAVISITKARLEFAKTMLLDSFIKEIQNLEQLLERDALLDYEKKVYEMALQIKEEELQNFLGIPDDRKNTNDKLSET